MKLITNICIITAIIFAGCSQRPKEDIWDITFKKLEKIKKQKKDILLKYFEHKHKNAISAYQDETLLSFFKMIQNNYNEQNKIHLKLNNYYIQKYSNFYDLLFINNKGFVFHSIKKESDYHKNIFSGELAKTNLAKKLNNQKKIQFSNFKSYLPSKKLASFYIIPVNNNKQFLGWIVLQDAINKINKVLSPSKDFGETGEVYIVNKNKIMLSKSRFINDSSLMKLKVDTIATKKALTEKSGNKLIIDYRGIKVFSSYEQFNYNDTEWIIIAEIDEEEIITEHYKKYFKYYNKKIRNQSHINKDNKKIFTGKNTIKVDMNEFLKAKRFEQLETIGISTCTAIIVSYPKKFGYLVHITPTDKIYNNRSLLVKYFLKDNYTTFLSDLIKHIKYYEIYPFELRKLQFTIISNHNNSFANIINELIKHKIEIAQIKFLYNFKASSANVLFNVEKNISKVKWIYEEQDLIKFTYSSDYKSLSKIVIDTAINDGNYYN